MHTCDACADCVWLGRDGFYDLYVCQSEARGTVLIARFGDRPHDFASLSMRNFKGKPDELTEPFRAAYMRAKHNGVIRT